MSQTPQTPQEPSFEFQTSGEACSVLNCGKLKIQKFHQCLKPIELKCDQIIILEEGIYRIVIDIKVKTKCPFQNVEVSLVASNEEFPVAETVFPACEGGRLEVERLFEPCTKLWIFFKRDGKGIESLKVEGRITSDPEQYQAVLLLRKTTAFDQALKVKWIPRRPLQTVPPPFPQPAFPLQYPDAGSVYPWFANIIPNKRLVPPFPGTPDSDAYKKFQSVQYSVFFYLGLDMFDEALRTSPEMTLFIKNLENRGYDNLLKKQYMYAMLCQILPFYKEISQDFMSELITRIEVNAEPVLSAFKETLITFFLRIHIGQDPEGFPALVRQYFRTFINIIGFGNPERPGRDEAMLFGWNTVGFVKEYFARRAAAVIDQEEKSTLVYWWVKSGLPPQSLVIESVHNIVAFSQLENTLFRLIADATWKNTPPPNPNNFPFWFPQPPVPPPIPSIDFFQKMIDAGDDGVARLDVVREAFRILAPNTNSFSKVITGELDQPAIQGRHVHQLIMLTNEGGPLQYFTFNTARYAAFDTTVDTCNPPIIPDNLTSPFPVEQFFEVSPVDNETLLDRGNPKLFPVFATPTYMPFGLGYRRCAGEELVYMLTELMIRTFIREVNVNGVPTRLYRLFEFRPFEINSVDPYRGYETLGPFTAVPDNLFLKGPTE